MGPNLFQSIYANPGMFYQDTSKTHCMKAYYLVQTFHSLQIFSKLHHSSDEPICCSNYVLSILGMMFSDSLLRKDRLGDSRWLKSSKHTFLYQTSSYWSKVDCECTFEQYRFSFYYVLNQVLFLWSHWILLQLIYLSLYLCFHLVWWSICFSVLLVIDNMLVHYSSLLCQDYSMEKLLLYLSCLYDLKHLVSSVLASLFCSWHLLRIIHNTSKTWQILDLQVHL